MKSLFVKDITSGQSVENLIVGIRELKDLKDKNGKPYYDVDFIDKTGFLRGKIWSEKIAQIDEKLMKPGVIVSISGYVSTYKEQKQIAIHDMILADTEEFEAEDVMIITQLDLESMWQNLLKRMEEVSDIEIKELLKNMMDVYGEKLKTHPAAERLHHAYTGGMVEHLNEMFSLMDGLKTFYTNANFELITAGIFLHDIGKLEELEVNGFTTTRTDVGKLVGHLILSFKILHQLLPDNFSDDKLLELEHMILAHHGELEFGSPVTPKTLEAQLLHSIDNTSSKLRQYKRIIDENESNEASFSQKDWAVNTEIYLTPYKK